jgi:hypothetical protein
MIGRGFIRVVLCVSVVILCAARASVAQTPQPFPRPGEQRPVAPPPADPAPAGQQPVVLPPPSREPAPNEVPTEATLGVPIYPGADFIGSFDAGRGQRYYLFGTTSDFTQIVNYYKSVLKQKGELVYEEPAIHQFDIGRFREESMAFPPSVSVKDYTWGGSLGYLNPKRGAQPARFKTVIQIVPVPALQ